MSARSFWSWLARWPSRLERFDAGSETLLFAAVLLGRRVNALQLSQEQAAQQVVLDCLWQSISVEYHELREHLGDFLGDEAELEGRVGIDGGVLAVAKRDRPQLEQPIGERAEVLDVLLRRARRFHRAELPGAVD